jgi:hypothetical protein
MQFQITEDTGTMVLKPMNDKDVRQLENAFGLKGPGDSIVLTRRAIVAPEDAPQFVLDGSIKIAEKPTPTKKAPPKKKKEASE